MKTIIFNITHGEVFEDIIKEFENETSKHMNFHKDGDNVIVNITGTLEELENE